MALRLRLAERLAARAETLESAGAPPSVLESFAEARRVTAVRNLLLSHEESVLLQLFAGAGIPAIPLKGVSLARILHDDPAARAVSDVDIAVRPADVACAAAILRERGYRVSLPDNLLQCPAFVHGADEITAEVTALRESLGFRLLVELHWKLLPGDTDAALWPALHEYMTRGSGAAEAGVRALSPGHYFLYLCSHLANRGWTGLRALCDAADFLLRYAAQFDVPVLMRHAEAAGIRHRVGVTLALLEAYFGIRWSPWLAMCTARSMARAQRAAAQRLLRPFEPAFRVSPGAFHRERLSAQDDSRGQLRYLAWLMRPTNVERISARGDLRSASAACLARAARLARLAWKELPALARPTQACPVRFADSGGVPGFGLRSSPPGLGNRSHRTPDTGERSRRKGAA